MFGTKSQMIEPDRALPGRSESMPVPSATPCSAPAWCRRSPTGRPGPSSGWAASGVPRRSSGRSPASTPRPWGTPAGTHPTRPMKRCARGAPDTPRPSSSCSTPPWCPTRTCCAPSGNITTRRKACGKATTPAPSTAPRSTSPTTPSVLRPKRHATSIKRRSTPRAPRHHHRDRPRRRLLLRRGLPPAVPGQEPDGLLRARRHRRVLSDRAGLGGVNRPRPARPSILWPLRSGVCWTLATAEMPEDDHASSSPAPSDANGSAPKSRRIGALSSRALSEGSGSGEAARAPGSPEQSRGASQDGRGDDGRPIPDRAGALQTSRGSPAAQLIEATRAFVDRISAIDDEARPPRPYRPRRRPHQAYELGLRLLLNARSELGQRERMTGRDTGPCRA